MREIEVRVDIPGFRTESLIVVTSLFDHRVYTCVDIAFLYQRRWFVELELRDIKTTMDLNVLRRKTPAAVRQELWTGLLAYNLVRQSLLQSAVASARQPHQLKLSPRRCKCWPTPGCWPPSRRRSRLASANA